MLKTIFRVIVPIFLILSASAGWTQVQFILLSSDPQADTITRIPPAQIILTFSEPASPSGIVITRGGQNVPGAITVGPATDGTQLTFTPAAPFTDGEYTVDYSKVTSRVGYPVENATPFIFTVDTTPPAVLTSMPSPSAVDVPLDTLISLTFSEDVSAPNRNTHFDLLGPGGESIPMNLVSYVGFTATYKPASLLSPGSTYTVDYSAIIDAAGNPPVPPPAFTFATRPPLQILSSIPADLEQDVPLASTVELRFNMPVNPTSSTITVRNGGLVAGSVSAGADSSILIFTPSQPLGYGRTYIVDFSGVRDTDGLPPTGSTTLSFSTLSAPPLVFLGSTPTDGAQDVPISSPITLTYNNDMNAAASSVVLQSPTGSVAGTLSAAGPILTFTPSTPLRTGTRYILQVAATDIYGQSLAAELIRFTTETGGLIGRADPSSVRLAANERTGVTFFIQNNTSTTLRLRSEQVVFAVNGAIVRTLALPLEISAPANGTGSAAGDASIDEVIQTAAASAGVDEVIMSRTFRVLDAGEQQTEVPIDLSIRISGSLVGAVSVTEVLLDVPPEGKSVGQFDQIRAHAFVRGTGNGAIVGTWFVDEQPVETFQVNMFAGLAQEVWTRMTLPALDLGEHTVRLRIDRPEPLDSNVRRYVVISGDAGTQRISLTSPRSGAALQADAVRTSYRWAPMPGASGYEIAFAADKEVLDAGLESVVRNRLRDGAPLARAVWTDQMVSSGRLLLLARVGVSDAAWRPTPEEYERIFAGPGNRRYWAVRAVYPGQRHGDPTTTSRPRELILIPTPASLGLISPAEGEAIRGPIASFEWEAGPPGVTYELAIMFGGQTVHTALTRETHYTLSELSPFKLKPGAYSWRVSAVRSGEGVVAASGRRFFTVVSQQGRTIPDGGPNDLIGPEMQSLSASIERKAESGRSSRRVNQGYGPVFAPVAVGGVFALLPGASEQISITPADGARIADQQPEIKASYPEAKSGGVYLTLNGVDVTSLAVVGPTSLVLQPPGIFSEGQHTVSIVVMTAAGAQLQAASTFTVAPPAGAVGPVPTEPDTEEGRQARPLIFEFDWNWRGSSEKTTLGELVIDLNVRGQQSWVWRNDSYGAINFQLSRPAGEKMDLANFLAQAGLSGGRHKLLIGDVGAEESPLTAQGLMHRSFNFITTAGPIRLTASHTLGRLIQRSSLGRAPDMLLISAETAPSSAGKGLKLTYVDSKDDLSSASFAGPAESRVLSLSGRAPLGKTGFSLRGEMANSDSTSVTAFGSQDNNGNAFSGVLEGSLGGFNLSAGYRKASNDYASPASLTLTNNLKGWTYTLSRTLGRYATASGSYVSYDNAGNTGAPASSVRQRALDLMLAYPNWPSISVRLAKNDASSAPFVPGGVPGDNEENVLAITANYTRPAWSTYVSYSRSDFDDFFDVIQRPPDDPIIDTPNDRTNGSWIAGLSVQPARNLRFRFDWSTNTLDRWLLPISAYAPVAGTDDSRNHRLQLEYLVGPRLSATVGWSESSYEAALGTFRRDLHDLIVRLNYRLLLTPAGGGLVVTSEFRRTSLKGTVSEDTSNVFSILVNDNRLFTF